MEPSLNNFPQELEGTYLSEREVRLILMYREIDAMTNDKKRGYSYFDLVYRTTENVIEELKQPVRFPELEALKANLKQRMEKKNG